MNKILEYLKGIYNNEEIDRILIELGIYKESLKKIPQIAKDSDWYKCLVLYSVYPNGVFYNSSVSPLKNLLYHIEHLKNLGCNAVHILPFFESPLIDKGFDINDYYSIRKDLGTMQDLHKVREECDRSGIRIFIDLVLNHVSDQHEWFQRAQQGDLKYRKYFIFSKEKPNFIRKYYKDSAVWALYKEGNKEIRANIGFPELVGEIPHWRLGKDNYWYYHTYYPQQLDLSWLNPDVFIDMAKVMMYWSSLGFDFRLDSIPFVGKSSYKCKEDESSQITYLIIAALKHVVNKINSETVFLVESFEDLDTVKGYFGSADRPQAELAYNFHLSTHIWVSLIKQDVFYIWQTLDRQKNIPSYAAWLNFLRNHDELSLAYLGDELVDDVRGAILKFGKSFREKFGVSGRTLSLLGSNIKKFRMAYFLLASFPGGMLIPYGDEIGYKNIPSLKIEKRERADTRNINRGTLLASELKIEKNSRIISYMANIIFHKKNLHKYFKTWPKKIDFSKEIYAACYVLENSQLLVYVNLSKNLQEISANLINVVSLFHVNKAYIINGGKTLMLGPYGGIWLLSN